MHLISLISSVESPLMGLHIYIRAMKESIHFSRWINNGSLISKGLLHHKR